MAGTHPRSHIALGYVPDREQRSTCVYLKDLLARRMRVREGPEPSGPVEENRAQAGVPMRQPAWSVPVLEPGDELVVVSP